MNIRTNPYIIIIANSTCFSIKSFALVYEYPASKVDRFYEKGYIDVDFNEAHGKKAGAG